MNIVHVTSSVKVGEGHPLLLIAGPCQIESREHTLRMVDLITDAVKGLPISLVYKSSFDKANRTSLGGQRGVGIEDGLRILQEVKTNSGLPVITDIHTAEQAQLAAEVVDILQIPAFLCRQTDLLLAAGQTGKALNVKKGQFLPPVDMRFVAEKIASTGNKNILLCERGASFGYRDLIVDMRSLVIMRSLGYPVVLDAAHSVQSMGGVGGSSGGSKEFIAPLARAAAAVGIDGIFIESHNDPLSAPSDGQSMLPVTELRGLLETVCRIREAARS